MPEGVVASLLAGLPSRGKMRESRAPKEEVSKREFSSIAAPAYIWQDAATTPEPPATAVVASEDVWGFFARFPAQSSTRRAERDNKTGVKRPLELSGSSSDGQRAKFRLG
eukprot:CAMPEP_0180412162 /NCGR_PEP_ID=MMETSP0989-20121125/44391_1 /TAXON_ID=697907 /ORGANISM="non described non described, Strain CCMP2293" /LENGTH=109 /DNA_ID=CAMNT_0022416605 /DNA_START=64 /DNA_END=393 /DNA_ORIENTATION=-